MPLSSSAGSGHPHQKSNAPISFINYVGGLFPESQTLENKKYILATAIRSA
jgi:hypothetical protein